MRVVMTGATGLIGAALVSLLESTGYQVIPLRRGPCDDSTIPSWNPLNGDLSDHAVDGVDAVVHLAGENIAGGRWTKARKARIRDSRVDGTRHLSEALARLERPPKTLIVASAVGFYGDRGEERVHEQSSAGTGFLPEMCQAWEAAAEPAVSRRIRVVQLRLGIVLTPAGGALGQMLLPFKLGLGGVLGSGQQYMSWVALDDVLTSVLHALRTESLTGPVNVVAPAAVTNKEFTKTLGRVLRRPTIFPVPGFVARILFGEMADALLLASTYVEPTRLQGSGFVFGYPTLEQALEHVLDRRQC